jgi:hypothetical protein
MKQYALLGVWGLLCCGWTQAVEYGVDLNWTDSGFSQIVRMGHLLSEVAHEPPFEGKDVICGKVRLHRADPIDICWSKSDRKLYLDLNGDGDFTNDPNEVLDQCEDNEDVLSYEYCFEPFIIERPSEFGIRRYAIETRILYFGGSTCSVYFYQISGYTGQFQDENKTWELSIIDVLHPDEDSNFTGLLNPPQQAVYQNWWQVPENLFLGGRNYAFQLNWTPQDDYSILRAVLTESPAPMGQLEILGQWIGGVVFSSFNTIAILENGESTVPVPAGQYMCHELFLKVISDSQDVHLIRPSTLDIHGFIVPENGIAQFKGGGPLNPTPTITKIAAALHFDFALLGHGGETYNILQFTSQPPKLYIYKDNLLLNSGQFQFG